MLLRTNVLIANDERREVVDRTLTEAGAMVTTVSSVRALRGELERSSCDLVVLGQSAGGEKYIALVREILEGAEAPEVIVLGSEDDAQARGELLAAGCLAVLPRTIPRETFVGALRSAIARRLDLVKSLLKDPPGERDHLRNYPTKSAAMREFLEMAGRVAARDTTILLLGETGVGKGVMARSLHNDGPRSGEAFVAVNCGALTETLLESELFGHEKGAFTSAHQARRGRFELAHRGTLFLDEVGEIPIHLQAKLLTAIEDRYVQPLGSERSIPIDVRIIAATNRDLAVEVEEKRFRQDLYYRLNVVGLRVPALRERAEDISQLALSFVEYFSHSLAVGVRPVASDAMRALVSYSWPGNIRELSNAIERAVIMSSGPDLELDDFPAEVEEFGPMTEPVGTGDRLDSELWLDRPWREVRRQVLDEAEMRYLSGLLRECAGKVSESANRAGMDSRSLREKMRKYGLRKEAFRSAS